RSPCIVPWLGDTRTEMRDSRPTGAPLYSAARPGVADEEPWGRATELCRWGTARRARAWLCIMARCRESLSNASLAHFLLSPLSFPLPYSLPGRARELQCPPRSLHERLTGHRAALCHHSAD